MIIVRSPLPIALGSGCTDRPSYYRDYGEFIVAAAI
jgi:D-glycero-alpha-D-manno-heptose-7-phosphate kinase